jgi:hypothetical protein
MSRHATAVLLCAGVLAASELEPLPTLPPSTAQRPAAPLLHRSEHVQPTLADQLDQRIARLEAAIASTRMQLGSGSEPALPSSVDDPRLGPTRRERDAAWRDLERALMAAAGRSQPRHSDVLDRPGRDDPVAATLIASNALAVVQSYHELLAAGHGTPEDLMAARQAGAAIDAAALPAGERARLGYLRCLLALEALRRGEAKALDEARRHLADLERDEPGSVLTLTARRILDSWLAAQPAATAGLLRGNGA